MEFDGAGGDVTVRAEFSRKSFQVDLWTFVKTLLLSVISALHHNSRHYRTVNCLQRSTEPMIEKVGVSLVALRRFGLLNQEAKRTRDGCRETATLHCRSSADLYRSRWSETKHRFRVSLLSFRSL